MEAIKLNNAAWIPHLSKEIHNFCQKAHVEGIQAGNLQTYFAQLAQGWYGKDAAEFWVVFDDNKPIAFAAWYILGLPHIAKVYCLAMYSWVKDPKPAGMLMDEFIKFGIRHNAVWWSADLVSKSLVRLVRKKAKERGYNMKESGIIHINMRRK